MEYCGEYHSLCYYNLFFFLIPLLTVFYSYYNTKQSSKTRYVKYNGNLPSFSAICFGKSKELGSERVYLAQWLDIMRILIALTTAFIPLLTLGLANDNETVVNDTSSVQFQLNGFHVWFDALIVNGLLPQIIFFNILIHEIRSGISESYSCSCFTLLNLFCQCLKLIWLIEYFPSFLIGSVILKSRSP